MLASDSNEIEPGAARGICLAASEAGPARTAPASLGAAKAELLPKFTLSFSGSIDRLAYRGLPPVTDHLFNIGLGIFWPLFNAGRIHANIAAHDAALREAEYAFDQALLNALQDVESAYTDVRAQRERGARLTRAVDSAQRSSTLAQALYEAGEADFLSVLDAHTQLLDTQRDLVQAQTDAAVSAVSLTWRSAAAGRTRVKNQRSRASLRNTEGQAMNDSTTTLTQGAVPNRRTVILTQPIARACPASVAFDS